MSLDRSPPYEDGGEKDKNSPMLLEEYKQKIPRRKKNKAKLIWCGLSSTSWVFLTAALLQGIVVTGFQIAIAITGRGRLEDYVNCLERSLSKDLDANITIPKNSSIPNFGTDKQIYGIFFIGLVLYNFFLMIYALTRKNIVEVYSFIIVNVLLMIYACFQVYQFRGFGISCEEITDVGYLALANAIFLLISTVVFMVLSLFIYAEFGWQVFVLVNGNPAMRFYYRVYRTFMSVIKLVIIFLIIFSIAQCVLLLTSENYEFGLTILMIFACVLATPVIYIMVTSESKLAAILILLTGFALVGYFIFKIFRFETQTCPLCRQQVAESEAMREALLNEIGLNKSEDISLDALTRAGEFQQLTILGVVNLVFIVAAMIIFIHYLRQYGKGLKELFDEHWFNRIVYRIVYRILCACRRARNDMDKK